MKNFTTTNKKKVFAIVIWIGIWQIISLIVNQPLFLPSPIQTIVSLIELGKTTTFYISVGATLLRVLTGLLTAIILGIAFGLLSTKTHALQIFFEPVVSTIKSIPVMSFIILALLYLKSSYVPVLVCILLCFPVIYTNTQKGILSIDKKLIELAHLYKVSKVKIFTHIKLPAIMPYLLSAVLISIGFSWKSVVTAEVLSAPLHSIGYNLYTTKLYLDTQSLFAWTLIIVILSIIIEKIANNLYQNSKWHINGDNS
ncbi:MAG: ABC transporter permease subunit [Clostridiales bacterium]|nr:ABC transporter permease subunit [Clostridiales bacterium]